MSSERDAVYREVILEPLRKCAFYTPKFGQSEGGLTIDTFTELYGSDPLYSWIGFDSPLMYAAHKAAGGMTSLYRQLGIGCERLFQRILRDMLGLDKDEASWKYALVSSNGGIRYQRLDARIDLQHVSCVEQRVRVEDWLGRMRDYLRIRTEVAGAVFEVRQGYKSKDSKRQNADLANAAKAISEGYIPVLAIMSSQLDSDIRVRYQVGKWGVLSGMVDNGNTLESTFAFFRNVIGYDLRAFFERNKQVLREEVTSILGSLLRPT